ncbi:MAG TPA: LuxR C-terminal-related transcriptional regulator [Gaiellaceae bacterium]|nr:LuxR C-terminal-related transcriptional regulator [Gaiellaceae bacterium]
MTPRRSTCSRRLPGETRAALLVASALSQPTLELVDGEALAPAEAGGVIRVDEKGRIEFSHPLLASAVYDAAPAVRRRQVHASLAELVPDPEERARHLALAADEPDERVAVALVDAARAARARGAPDAAIELLELACLRTPAEPRGTRERRELELGTCLAEAGDPKRAASILRPLVDGAGEAAVRLRAGAALMVLIESSQGGPAATAFGEQLLAGIGNDALLEVQGHTLMSRTCDHDVARTMLHARAARELLPHTAPSPELEAWVLIAVAEAEFYAGKGIAHEELARADLLEQSLESSPPPPGERLLPHLYPGLRASARQLSILWLYSDELDRAREAFVREYGLAVEHGDDSQVAKTLCRLATVELRSGRWDLAAGHVTELLGIVDRIGDAGTTCWSLSVKTQLDAALGRVEEGRQSGLEALALSEEIGAVWQTAQSSAALGFLELTAGELAEAKRHLDRVEEIEVEIGLADPGIFRHHADRVETLLALGELEAAEAALERLERMGAETSRPLALATGARCRGLLLAGQGDLAGASVALERALAEHERLPIPFERARTLLVQGQILRRRKQRMAARAALGHALDLFQTLGAPFWAERARAEVERTHVREAPDELSPTEERVAALAASGLTNRQIAERLFLSPKTVEANLARAYRKLGIRSRAELGARMAGRQPAADT